MAAEPVTTAVVLEVSALAEDREEEDDVAVGPAEAVMLPEVDRLARADVPPRMSPVKALAAVRVAALAVVVVVVDEVRELPADRVDEAATCGAMYGATDKA